MVIFWTVVTFAVVAAIVAWAVWAFLIEPIRVPRHHHGR
jgi:hypothetical protein